MRQRMWGWWVSILALAGCSSVQPEHYAATAPTLVLEEYFLGATRAWGIFQDRAGRVKRQFVVDLHGVLDGGELVLTEDFEFRDGELSRRVWRIRRLNEHQYEGRADDVIGVAKGEAWGQALHWRYHLLLRVAEREYKVHFDDWMYLQEDGILINRATMSKFGFRLGELTIVFRKVE